MTVALIDDDRAMLSMLRDVLHQHGMDVATYDRGETAVAAVESAPVDAIVVDKEMPGMGGFDVLRLLHSALPTVPVILITAFGGARVAEEALRLGARGYLEKPF